MTPYNQFFAGNDGGALEINNSTFANPDEWLYNAFTGGQSSGTAVNGYTALTWCPFWQGVNIVAGDLAQVPFNLTKDEFDEQKNHYVWKLLRRRPNKQQSPSVFFETMIQWMLVWGNAVAWTPRIGSRVEQIIPLRPDCLWYELVGDEGGQTIVYRYQSPTKKSEYIFLPDEVVHIKGLTSDGYWGYPLWQIGKNTIRQGLSQQENANSHFSNGSQPSGVLEHPSKLQPDAVKQLRRLWDEVHRGPDNAGKVAILTEGMKYNHTSFSNTDSQFVEMMNMSDKHAACLLNLPAYKLNSQDHIAAQANLEEQNETYRTQTLARIANCICQEFERKLLTEVEYMGGHLQIKPNWDYFLRADVDTATQVADRNVKATIWNPNEARAYLGYPPREGGEVYGSPAINPNPKRPEDGKESPDNGRPKGATTENAHRELLLDHMLHFLDRENNSITQSAKANKSGENFVKWLDSYYLGEGGDKPTIFEVIDGVMGSSVRACFAAGLDARGITTAIAGYAKARHAQLLEACSNVTKEQLPAAVERLQGQNTALIAQGLLATALGETNGT